MQDTDRVQKQAEQMADKGMFALKEKQAAEVHEALPYGYHSLAWYVQRFGGRLPDE